MTSQLHISSLRAQARSLVFPGVFAINISDSSTKFDNNSFCRDNRDVYDNAYFSTDGDFLSLIKNSKCHITPLPLGTKPGFLFFLL